MQENITNPPSPFRRRTEIIEEWFEPSPEMCPPGYEPVPSLDGPEPDIDDADHDGDDE